MGRKSVPEDKKWQIIGLSKDKTKDNYEIAEILGVSEFCVRKTKAKFAETGTVSDSPRSGRPNKTTDRDKSIIFREARRNPSLSLRKLASDFNSKSKKVTINKDTVRKILKNKGIGSYIAVRKPMLTVRDRLKRMKWCKERLRWSIEDWTRVIFSDESNFEVFNRKSQVIVKRLKSEKYSPRFVVPRIQKGGGSVGIWGCISHKGTGCCTVYTGRINQYKYMETLENYLKPSVNIFYGESDNWFFQQDGATAHTANSVKAYFDEKNIKVIPWCARSPDLNPIENLWSYMDSKLVPTKLTSIEHLKETLKIIWNQIPKEYVMKLIESMPNRVRSCYKARGGHFKY